MEEVEASEPDLGLRPPPEVLLQCQPQINAKCEYRCGLDARRTWSFEENEASFAAVAAVAARFASLSVACPGWGLCGPELSAIQVYI